MTPDTTQLLQLLIPLVTPLATPAIVMVGFMYNNARLNDLRDLLRAEMAKNQSELLHKFAELDNRLIRLEQGR